MRKPTHTKQDCIRAAKMPHPLYAARTLWPNCKYPSSKYARMRKLFEKYGVKYPWPEKLPKGKFCVEKAMGRVIIKSRRANWKSTLRAYKERRVLKTPRRRKKDVIVTPKDIWTLAMREATKPQYWGTASIIENEEE